jgi:hypothetical protein
MRMNVELICTYHSSLNRGIEETEGTRNLTSPITGFLALIPSQTLIGLVTVILIVVILWMEKNG